MNFSKRSFFALQMGQISGACSRAQRYPHTLQRHTGRLNRGDNSDSPETLLFKALASSGGRRSGIGLTSSIPLNILSET